MVPDSQVSQQSHQYNEQTAPDYMWTIVVPDSQVSQQSHQYIEQTAPDYMWTIVVPDSQVSQQSHQYKEQTAPDFLIGQDGQPTQVTLTVIDTTKKSQILEVLIFMRELKKISVLNC